MFKNYIQIKAKVSGTEELARAFRELDDRVQKRVIVQASRKVAKGVADEFKALTVPITSSEEERSPKSKQYGHAIDNIRVTKQKRKTAVSVHWGAAFWMFFREYGARKSGRQPARPLYRPHWDANVANYSGRMVTELWRSIQQQIKAVARKQRKAAKT